jgi:hypothetical protein
MHIPLIHLTAFATNAILFGSIHQDWYETAPFVTVPEDMRWGLALLYIVWVIDVPLLYFLCRWYAKYKAGNPGELWLRYL